MTIARAEADWMLSRYVMLALRIGMYVSFVLLVLGVLGYLAFDGQVGFALMPWEALQSALRGEAIGLMSLGIVCLIATPLAGVATALLVFLRAREWNLVAVALAVLAVVILAIFVKTVT